MTFPRAHNEPSESRPGALFLGASFRDANLTRCNFSGADRHLQTIRRTD